MSYKSQGHLVDAKNNSLLHAKTHGLSILTMKMIGDLHELSSEKFMEDNSNEFTGIPGSRASTPWWFRLDHTHASDWAAKPGGFHRIHFIFPSNNLFHNLNQNPVLMNAYQAMSCNKVVMHSSKIFRNSFSILEILKLAISLLAQMPFLAKS